MFCAARNETRASRPCQPPLGRSTKEKGDRQAADLWRHCLRKLPAIPSRVTTVLLSSPHVTSELALRIQGVQRCPPPGLRFR